MSNPLPLSQPAPMRGSRPASIEPHLYPALAQLRLHATSGGSALIDRVYAEAQELHKRARVAEDIADIPSPGPRVVTDAFPSHDVWGQPRQPTAPKVQTPKGDELL